MWFAGVCGRRKTVLNTSECDAARRDEEAGIQSGSSRGHRSQRPTKSRQISEAEAFRRRRIERSGYWPCFLAGTSSSGVVHRTAVRLKDYSLLLTLTNGASGARQRRALAGRVPSFDVTATRFPPAFNPSKAPIFSTLACVHPCTPEPPARVWEKVADQAGSGPA